MRNTTVSLLDDRLFSGTDRMEGGGSPRCQWERDVCTLSPTHYVGYGDHEEPHSVALYCTRHYVLTLEEFMEVHAIICDQPLSAHVNVYGPLA